MSQNFWIMQTQKMSEPKNDQNPTEQPSVGSVFKIQKSKVLSYFDPKQSNQARQNDS